MSDAEKPCSRDHGTGLASVLWRKYKVHSQANETNAQNIDYKIEDPI
jgi:hypothetical protein